VIDLAHRLGWKAAHFTPMQDKRGVWRTPASADGKGFPDLILDRDELIAAEIKGDRDRLRPEQQLWLDWLDRAGIRCFVWTSRDWESGSVETVLRGRPS
jgi:hypothetical protein